VSYIKNLFFSRLIFFILYIFSGCSTGKNIRMPSSTFLALGDSYTIGESVAVSENFPNQTVQLLKKKGINIGHPLIVATTGWTTTDLINALSSIPKHQYDYVTLLIGVNNQYRGLPIQQYKTDFEFLLKRAIEYSGNNINSVFVLSIPDYSVTPFAAKSDTVHIANEIDEYNKINKEIAQQLKVHYIDITNISRRAKNEPSMLAPDGLHPSAVQYSEWAKLLAASIIPQ